MFSAELRLFFVYLEGSMELVLANAFFFMFSSLAYAFVRLYTSDLSMSLSVVSSNNFFRRMLLTVISNGNACA